MLTAVWYRLRKLKMSLERTSDEEANYKEAIQTITHIKFLAVIQACLTSSLQIYTHIYLWDSPDMKHIFCISGNYYYYFFLLITFAH